MTIPPFTDSQCGATETLRGSKRPHTEVEKAEEEFLPHTHPSLSSSPGGASAVCSFHLLSHKHTHFYVSKRALIPNKDVNLDATLAALVAEDGLSKHGGCDIWN